jgi:beta-mannanase
MYRHIHDIFAAEGVTNVEWAWVVNHESIPNEEWNHVDNYYPGDEYVDIISVDGYNWGHGGFGGWKTFDEIFGAMLMHLSSTHPTQPLVIGEFASVEGTDPMSKANWITDAYSRIESDWPQIKAALWFNFPGKFTVGTSPESIQAYREAIADPYFTSDRVYCIYLPVILKYH